MGNIGTATCFDLVYSFLAKLRAKRLFFLAGNRRVPFDHSRTYRFAVAVLASGDVKLTVRINPGATARPVAVRLDTG
jgi:hypothetical protein